MLLAGLFLVLAIVMQWTGWLPPWLENNTIDRAGIGPYTIYDGLPRNLADLDRSPGLAWRLAGLAAALGLAGLVHLLFAVIRRLPRLRSAFDGQLVFLLLATLAYLGPFIITGYFDRYLLFVLPFLMLLWSQVEGSESVSKGVSRRSLALGWLAVTLLVSGLATHDYFQWNRARWQAIERAEALGASPHTLDGGFEYNGFHRFEILPRKRYPGKSFWWVKDDEFAVSFSEVPGYRTVAEFPVDGKLARTPEVVRLLRRESPEPRRRACYETVIFREQPRAVSGRGMGRKPGAKVLQRTLQVTACLR